MFALVDGNAFYASCETLFRPDIAHLPVVVLSNNDGCVVAANARAKKLGDIMLQPYFKVRGILEKHQTAVFSSNYELYADLSQRMHSLLGSFAPQQEIYSIDESFLDFTGMTHWDLSAVGQQMKQAVQQQLGLPVAVGIGATKTLAKAANHLAKKQEALQGVLHLSAPSLALQEIDQLLSAMSVANVWGVGRQWSGKLKQMGIQTACDLKYASRKNIRTKFGVVLERTVAELNGQVCQNLELIPTAKQQIISSRSFGEPVITYQAMRDAVAAYTSRAVEKLRQQNAVCKRIQVSIMTNAFRRQEAQYCNWASVSLIYPSAHTGHLIERATSCLNRIWRDGFAYKKALVMLTEISEVEVQQFDLFADHPRYSRNVQADSLMQVMDQINHKYGRGTLHSAATGQDRQADWQMKRSLHSPRYTTHWDELLLVR